MSAEQLIRITSWNVAGKEPMNDTMLDYLFDDSRRLHNLRPDIQIVGLQEAPQYLFSDPWTSNLSTTLRKRGYILFKRHKLSGILLYIFVLREIMLRARDFETESVKTGFGGLLGNKGGVSLRFSYNGNSFSATNSHLAAHQEQLQQRIQDYKSILEGTKFLVNSSTPSVLNHDYAFWFGDLNFRLDDIEKHRVLDIITKAKTSNSTDDREKLISSLYKNDQLISVKKRGLAFSEFTETLPKFLPTYKFQIGTKDAYDSEQRIPAWTDRILYRYNENQTHIKPKLEQLFYECLPETDLSDHKPVVSMFRVKTYDPREFNPSNIPYEVVKFEQISGWRTATDGRLWYKISNELFYRRPKILSSWDRLALYKADFASLEDYLTIVFANNIARMAPRLDAQEVAYSSSTPSSRASSRRGSVSSTTSSNSSVSMGTEALSLNDPPVANIPIPAPIPTVAAVSSGPAPTEMHQSSSNLTATGPAPSQIVTTARIAAEQVVVNALPDDATIGDGFKYFTATFSDDIMVPGKYVVLYLKTNAANEYDVYGISDTFEISPSS